MALLYRHAGASDGAGAGGNLLWALESNSVGVNLQWQYHLDVLGSVQAITGSTQAVETRYRSHIGL